MVGLQALMRHTGAWDSLCIVGTATPLNTELYTYAEAAAASGSTVPERCSSCNCDLRKQVHSSSFALGSSGFGRLLCQGCAHVPAANTTSCLHQLLQLC
jgi:hypothetical protein